MTLPDAFSPAEHLQDTIRRIYNRQVREWFSDLGADADLDISTPRASLRTACWHQDADSLLMTQIRQSLFDYLMRSTGAGIAVADEKPSYGIYRKHKPQILLYFQQDSVDIEDNVPVTGRISFRIMNHTNESLTPPIAEAIARDIRSEFAVGNGWIWKKGRLMISYSDWDKGYQLQLLCHTESVGRELIRKVLSIQNDTPDWRYMNISQNAEPASTFPTVRETEFIFGESRRLPRRRPIADVRFRFATLKLYGVPNPIALVDLSGQWENPLIDLAS